MGLVMLRLLVMPLVVVFAVSSGCSKKEKGESSNGLASGVGADSDQLAISALNKSMYPLTKEHCGACHGNGTSPEFAHPDIVKAYKAIMESGIVDFANPARSRPVQRLLDNHNCWSNCDQDSKAMQEAIAQWSSSIAVENEGSDHSTTVELTPQSMANSESWDDKPGLLGEEPISLVWGMESTVALSPIRRVENRIVTSTLASEFTPDQALARKELGHGTLYFNVEKKRNYFFFAKICGSGRENDSLFVKIDDKQINIWDILEVTKDCRWTKIHLRQFNDKDAKDVSNFKPGTGADLSMELTPGFHRIQFVERTPDLGIEKFGISSSATADLDDVAASDNSVMVFDLSKITGQESFMTVPIVDRYPTAYLMLPPEIWIASGCLKVKEVRPLVNGVFLPQHSSFMGVSKVASAQGDKLVNSSSTLLKDQGPGKDRFSFSFRQLQKTDCP